MYFDRSNYSKDYYLAYYIFVSIVIGNKTIRKIAQELKIPKSTIHYFIHKHCSVELGPIHYNYICNVLKKHYNIKHINGGEATRIKYKKLKEQKNGYIK